MKGYMTIFFTQQNRRYQGKMLGEWIVDVAKEMGLRGATLCTGIEGFGHTGKLHSSHFFELADQPTEIRLAITEDEAERLFKRLDSEEISVFFTKSPIEMGTLGKILVVGTRRCRFNPWPSAFFQCRPGHEQKPGPAGSVSFSTAWFRVPALAHRASPRQGLLASAAQIAPAAVVAVHLWSFNHSRFGQFRLA